MKVEVVADYEALSERAAAFVLEKVVEQPELVLALPTGNTPIGMYKRLVKAHQEGRADFSRLWPFALDEYANVAPQDEHSFGFFLHRHFIDPVGLTNRFDHLQGNAPDLVTECARYEAAIAAKGGLDLAILGLGVNGHIAFNEPGTPFDSRTHVVSLADSTREANAGYFPDGFRIPNEGISMGIGTVLAAREILVIASGKSKAPIVERIINEEPTTDIPASALKAHPNVLLIVDEEAACVWKR
ncbi:MAG TPA: glucosamine-6-phosphate deaminase [Firmicutes bacterium]|nr:glucosamine-6-phosphate deaminase [Bacillota bacterium]